MVENASLGIEAAAHVRARSFGRMFWLISGIGTLVTVVLLIALYEWQGRRAIREEAERTDRQFVQMIGNVLWVKYSDFLVEAQTISTDELRQHPGHTDLHETVVHALRESNVLKVKVFSSHDGRTLFSTESKQIGAPYQSPAYLEALAGRSGSELTFRDTFNGVRGVVESRDVLATYLPYYASPDAAQASKPDIVVEVYTDVTERVATHQRSRFMLAAGVMGSLALMYTLIWALGRSATRRLEVAANEKKEQEQRIHHQAYHDNLTGLPNRVSFQEQCATLGALSAPKPWGLLYIDLDRFKPINDSLGHSVGDIVLKKAATRITASMRNEDNVYRVGGDEFLVLVQTEDLAALETASRRIVATLAKPFNIDGLEIALSASVGIARWPADSAALDHAVGCADLAMYSAKRAGANQHAFYSADMKHKSDEQVRMLNGLRVALANDEFVLHYQPRVNSHTGDVESFEALLRWQHPELGLLQPARFIGVLEDSPLIVDVGAWVMETAAMQLAQWHREGHPHLRISVNVAARQFRAKQLVETVEHALARSGIEPQALELEITEGQLIHDLENATQTVRRLKTLGVMLSIDDFGTGYSSLSYLQELPIDCLKIDRAFVKDLEDGALQNNIARTIASLAHSLEMKVVAEGVETDTQAALLRGWGCEQLQGYLFSRPVPACDAALLLKPVTPPPAESRRPRAVVMDRRDPEIEHGFATSGLVGI